MNGDAWNRFCRSALSCAEACAEAASAAWSRVNAMGDISAATSKVRARHCFFRNLFIIICYLLQFQSNFGLKTVQFNVWLFRGRLHKVQSVFSDKAVIIAHDIDRLTEHWDAGSVPRAVASVAPEVGYRREPRSL